MMLRELLRLVETADGPVTVAQLGRQLGIEPAAIDGMLQHWVRKGLLTIEGRASTACSDLCATAACRCGSCAGAAGCPFMARLPKTYVATSPRLKPTEAARDE